MGKIVIVMVILLVLIGSVGGTALYYQNQLNNTANQLNSQVSNLRDQVSNLNALAGQSPNSRVLITSVNPNPIRSDQQVTLGFTVALSDTYLTAAWIDWGEGSAPDLILNQTSRSMCPTDNCIFRLGTLMMFHPIDPTSIQAGPPCDAQIDPNGPVGSVVAFRPYPDNPEYIVVHRVREISHQTNGQLSFRTQGDVNYTCDGWVVTSDQIIGEFQGTVPVAGKPLTLSDTHNYNLPTLASAEIFAIQVKAVGSNNLTTSTARTIAVVPNYSST